MAARVRHKGWELHVPPAAQSDRSSLGTFGGAAASFGAGVPGTALSARGCNVGSMRSWKSTTRFARDAPTSSVNRVQPPAAGIRPKAVSGSQNRAALPKAEPG